MQNYDNEKDCIQIAKFLEPEPTFIKKRALGRDALSDEGMWWCEWHNVESQRANHPRDFFADPEMTVMLIKRMIDYADFDSMVEEIRTTQAVLDDGTSDVFQDGVAQAFMAMESIR